LVTFGDKFFDGWKTFTVSSWAKFDSFGSDGVHGISNAVISKAGAGGASIPTGDDSIEFGTNGSGYITAYLDDNEDPNTYEGNKKLEAGRWYHLSLSYNGSQLKLYVNGRLDSKHSDSITLVSGDHHTHLASTYLLDSGELIGEIDQVKIFNRSLTQQEIVEKTQGLDSSGAVLDFRFDRNGGNKVHDHSSENNHGSLVPNESFGPQRVKGVTGGAVDFDGGKDLVQIEDTSSLDSMDTITIAAWVKPDSLSGRDDLIKKGGNYWFNIQDNGELSTYLNGIDPSPGYYQSNSEIKVNEWTHIAFTYNGSQIRQFINGDLDTIHSGLSGSVSSSNNDLNLGKHNTGGIDGSLDNIKIYPYAVSDSKVQKLYQQGKPHIGSSSTDSSSTSLQKGLVLSQTFNRIETCGQSDTISCPSGMSGEVAVDESGEANHGELVNGPTEKGAEDCRVGGCLGFDAEDDTVRVDRDSSIVSGSRSMSFWVNLDGELSQGSWEDIVGQGSMRVEVSEADTTTLNWYTTGGAGSFSVPNNEWVHVTVTATSDTAKMYTDGNIVGSFSVDTLNKTSGDLWIMSEKNSKYVGGKIDQVRVYNRSLSNQEVWKLYTQGRNRERGMAGPVAHYRFDAGPRICIYNGAYSGGGWNGPSSSALNSMLEDEGWESKLVGVGDLTENGWKQCEVIVNPHGEDMPFSDKSANFCSSVNVEGTEHDLYAEMKEFMDSGGLWVGSWGAGIWYPQVWDGSSWQGYQDSCSQYSGDSLYKDGGGARCSDIGYSCYSAGSYGYSNIDQSITPSISGTVTSSEKSYRWAREFDINWLQAYNSSSGNTISNKYVGIERYGEGYYLHPGSNSLMNPGLYENSTEVWNNILTWYAGGEGQSFWDSAGNNSGTISGNGNAPAYTKGKSTKAIKFDGSNDSVSTSSQLDLGSSGTVSAWFKKPSISGTKMIVDKYSGGSYGYSIWFSGNDLHANYGSCDFNGIASPSVNAWHHVTLVNSDSKNECKIFLDGEKIASASSGGNSDVGGEVDIGSRNGNSRFWKGKIDDLRIYPYALNKGQVKKVMNSGAASIR
jgi:hypothetical protein